MKLKYYKASLKRKLLPLSISSYMYTDKAVVAIQPLGWDTLF